jgi:formylmethanofuran dehydrogenase subunit B
LGGKITCTLGEVKNRADFIVYWGGNPAECHPRHFSKYTLTQKGKFVPEGRKGRTMVLVDIRETPSARALRRLAGPDRHHRADLHPARGL